MKHNTKIALITSSVVGGVLIILCLGFRYHPEQITKAVTVYHPAITHQEPAVTREIHHPAQTTTTPRSCIKANIGDYSGQCATGRCKDGTYTGTPHTSYYLTCSYHGGLAALGPFYTGGETIVIKEAWTQTIVDTPARTVTDEPAWTETITPEKVEPAYWTWFSMGSK